MDIQILDISTDDVDDEFIVSIYGKNNRNINVILHVNGFKPYFYLKVPNSYTEKYCKDILLKNIYYKYENYIDIKNSEFKLRSYKEFFNYHIDENENIKKFSFMKLIFHNYRGFLQMKRKIIEYYTNNINNTNPKVKSFIKCNNKDCESCLYEANIPPLIRFIHKLKIEPSNWINIQNYITIDDPDFKVLELSVHLNNVKKIDNNNISNYKIASFDIECDSSHGDFPLAIKDFKKPALDMIECYSIKMKEYCEYTIEQKIYIIKCIVYSLFDLDTEDSIDIDKIYLSTNKPNIDDNFELFSKSFISMIDKCHEDKKLRDNAIKYISNSLSKLKSKNKKIKIKGDPIIQIGTVFKEYGNDNIKRVIIVIPNESNDVDICDDIDGIDVVRCSNEKELINEWINLINIEDPDFITGYNILGFDFNYIHNRVTELFNSSTNNIKFNKNIEYNLGRININYSNKYYNKKNVYKKVFKKDIEDNNDFNDKSYINMDGRIIFDVQKEIEKSNNLESYKLDSVSSYFMRGQIKNIKKIKLIDDNKILHNLVLEVNTIRNLKINDYITINTYSNIGEMLYKDGVKFKIINIIDNYITIDITNHNVNKKELLNYNKLEWCLNKDDVSPYELFNLHKNGGGSGRAKIAKYCIQDCELCINLILLLDIIPNNMGMSNVCNVPLNFIFSRGQGIKVTSVVSKICDIKNTRIPTLVDQSHDNSGYEGAIVLDPNPGIYIDDPIAVLDYASLYPSSIIEENLSPETLVEDKEYIDKLKKENRLNDVCNIIEYDNYETILVGKTYKKIINKDKPIETCYFIKNKRIKDRGVIIPESMGIIPTVLKDLLDERKNTKKKMALEPDEFKRKILDGLQSAYKVTANSVYGQLGAKTSTIFKKKVAACTTSVGRKHIDDARRGVIEWAEKEKLEKPEIIYGDTDSVFIKFSRKTIDGKILTGDDAIKYTIDCGMKSGEYITKNILSYPQDLEYEKTFYPFILISKKRYIGDKYETIKDVDNKKFKRTSMGIVTKRRDNAPIVKYVFGNIIEKIIIDKNLDKTIEWLDKTLNDINNGKFSINYFIITKSLRGYYKNPLTIAHKVLADRIGERDPGNRPKAGDRIPYVYKKLTYEELYNTNSLYKSGPKKGTPKCKKVLQGDRIELPDYIKSNNVDIDYSFYISNQIMKPVEQVLELDNKYNKGVFQKYIN
uniref:DNA-directed DNA polymerase n=1 Tax=viral metagenome TaxID=1070528 RepID=A0A6C0CZ43_9ZZZZ